MRLVAALAIVAGGCGSCKEKAKPDPRPAASGSQAPRSAPPVRTASLDAAPSKTLPPGRMMTTVTVDEIGAVLPRVPSATVLEPPQAAPHGEQVHLAWCIPAADQSAAIEAVRAALSQSGYGEAHVRGEKARRAITADKPPFRLTASISASPRLGCSPADDKWFASVSVYKIESVGRPPALQP